MNKPLLAALAIVTLAGFGGYGLSNYAGAQGAPPIPPTDVMQPPAAADTWVHHRWMMDGEHPHHGSAAFARNRGLFYPQENKKLSATDVQTIAEAILLRHGNHTWRVTNVARNPDDTVSFAFATPTGQIIARFAMDTHTGRLRRLG